MLRAFRLVFLAFFLLNTSYTCLSNLAISFVPSNLIEKFKEPSATSLFRRLSWASFLSYAFWMARSRFCRISSMSRVFSFIIAFEAIPGGLRFLWSCLRDEYFSLLLVPWWLACCWSAYCAKLLVLFALMFVIIRLLPKPDWTAPGMPNLSENCAFSMFVRLKDLLDGESSKFASFYP